MGGLDSVTIGNVGAGTPKSPTLANTARMGQPSIQNYSESVPTVRAIACTASRYGVGFFAGAGAGVAGFGVVGDAGAAAAPALTG